MRSTYLVVISFLLATAIAGASGNSATNNSRQTTRPVIGAMVEVYYGAERIHIGSFVTDAGGNIAFVLPNDVRLEKECVFNLVIDADNTNYSVASNIVTLKLSRVVGRKFTINILWMAPVKAENRGAFAVSGKNST